MNLRLEKLRELLVQENLDAVLISAIPNITYLTNFSGFFIEDRDAYLLITKTKQYIFTHGIYKEAVQQQIKHFELISIQRENPINVALEKLIKNEKIKKLGFESFDLKVNEYNNLIKQIDKQLLMPIDLVGKLRIIKTTQEINAIRNACKIGDQAFAFILDKLKPNVTEKQIAVELEFFIKRQGADISFSPIVAFGVNASQPHHVVTNAKLKQNTLVLLDFGVKLDNYCSDMTRTVFFGEGSMTQKKVYQTVLDAQQKAAEFIKEKIAKKDAVNAKDVDMIAREYIINNGFSTIPHSLGHGIGLEVHEAPHLTTVSNDILKHGMVFSIEPGIYLPGEFGVRIEDLFAIEKNKLVQLTNAPKTLIEI